MLLAAVMEVQAEALDLVVQEVLAIPHLPAHRKVITVGLVHIQQQPLLVEAVAEQLLLATMECQGLLAMEEMAALALQAQFQAHPFTTLVAVVVALKVALLLLVLVV